MSDFFLDVLGFVIAVTSWSPSSLLIFSGLKTDHKYVHLSQNKQIHKEILCSNFFSCFLAKLYMKEERKELQNIVKRNLFSKLTEHLFVILGSHQHSSMKKTKIQDFLSKVCGCCIDFVFVFLIRF